VDRTPLIRPLLSLRGFREEALQPQKLVNQLYNEVNACNQTLSNVACSVEAQLLAAGAISGGDQHVAYTAELRQPVTSSFELAAFYDGGNLWQTAVDIFKTLVMRNAVGGGLRWLTPIGRMAIDIGVNLAPDALLGEPSWGPYFSIDPL